MVITIIPSVVSSFNKKTVKKQFDFSSVKTINYYSLTIGFLVENGNFEKQENIGSVKQEKM